MPSLPSSRRVPSRSFVLSAQQSSSSESSSSSSTKNDHKDILDFMSRPVESTVGDQQQSTDDESEIEAMVRCIAKAADGRKAENIVALKVRPITTLTSYLVILSGNSRPQNQAITAAVKKDMEEQFGVRPGGTGVPEGSAESGWMLLDYGSVMVHVMTPKSRLFYNVEGQWRSKGGVEMDLSDVLIPNRPEDVVQDGKNFDVPEEEDPFWS